MDKFTPEIDTKSIVLRGSFNPQLFQPAWFALNKLVHEDDAENASNLNINLFVAQFSLGGFDIQVTNTRFAISSVRATDFEPLRDIVIGTFMILRHTPINLLGINRQTHFRLETNDQLKEILKKIAPISEWDGILNEPSFNSLTTSGNREDGRKGYIRIKVEPSPTYSPGIFIDVNDHYDLSDESEKTVNADKAVFILKTNWDESSKKSEDIIYSIFSKRV